MNTPASLGPGGRRFWEGIRESRTVPATSYALVLNACRIIDRLDEISEMFDNDELSLTVTNDRGDEVANPLLGELRQQTLALNQILKTLGFGKLEETGSAADTFDTEFKALLDAENG
ncbi:hypothetical protein GCM10023147_21120 [Tsukamurella soli]|uniref:Phage terminase, small subunit, putative, P27 family n=2 Tax=Tsukamurella soli TaxID=644556 RepID=A0ABP8JJS6_9ACTN